MPAAKLTLRLDKQIIEGGKIVAKLEGTSLSRMIEQFLRERMQETNVYVPIRVITPDPELGALFPPRKAFSQQPTPRVKPVVVIEPDADILALMGKPSYSKPVSNREMYDDYAKMRYERYLKNSTPE